MNKVILVGNLTRDPELRQTPNGISVARFTVAVARRYSKDGNNQADFINCIAWRQQAEFLCKYFTKGSGIQLCGSLQTRNWDGQDGKRQFAMEVVAEELNFNGSKSENKSQNGYQNNNSMPVNAYQQNGGYVQNSGSQYRQEIIQNPPDDFPEMNYTEEDLPF